MLESIFITFIAIGFISFILGIELENVIYSALSLLMWIILMAGYFYIEVPSDTIYDEPVFLPVALAFIFINVIIIILSFTRFKEESRYRL